MVYKLKIEIDAAEELDQILNHITVNLDNKPAAKNLFDDIAYAFENIKEYPESIPLSRYENLRANNIRQLTVKNFALFYNIDEISKTVTVLHIKYAKSDLSGLFAKKQTD